MVSEVLVEFGEKTGAKMWVNNDNWLTNTHVCFWYGVTCNTAKAVIALNLRNNGLQLEAGFEQIDLVALLAGLSFLQVS